jgi:hypothetical protein
MLSPRWRKVIADLWLNKTRTILVVLSIAVGVFALGAITTSQDVLSHDMSESYAAINPASARIITADAFDDDLVEAVRGMREVGEAEGRRNASMRLQIGSGVISKSSPYPTTKTSGSTKSSRRAVSGLLPSMKFSSSARRWASLKRKRARSSI